MHSLSPCQIQNRGLRDENETLRERVRQLEELIGLNFPAPAILKLTRAENEIFGMLMRMRVVTIDSIITATGTERSEETKRVLIFRIRNKMKSLDLPLETVWGQGYRLTSETKARVKALIEAEAQ